MPAIYIRTPNRILEIDEFYFMALAFIISFITTRILKKVILRQIERRKLKQAKKIDIYNPRGGGIEENWLFADESELGYAILSCIQNESNYMLIHPKLVEIIFNLVKEQIKKESLVLRPNLIMLSAKSRSRVIMRLGVSNLVGIVTALLTTVSYAILMFLLFFDASQNCVYKCSDYFEQLPKEGPTKILSETATGHLFISPNSDAQQIEIYIPSKTPDELVVSGNGELKTTKTYTKARRKAKQVNFSDFIANDKALKDFKDLVEPEIPQKTCPLNDIHDAMGIRVE